MAKGNMLQGMARGKVGDVVFSRLDGQQITRVRNRSPKNPRTNAQLYQRAIMATIMQMYSEGKEIFDHSFEGKSAGAECQREFMSRNAKALRSAIAADLEEGHTSSINTLARVVAPKQNGAVPFSYIISNGTYAQNLFTTSLDDTAPQAIIAAPNTGESVAAYASRNNLVAKDIYTIVALASADAIYNVKNNLGVLASTPRTKFMFVRLTVKEGLAEVTDALTTLGQLFTIEKTVNVVRDLSTLAIVGNPITTEMLSGSNIYSQGAIGVIRSRKDEDKRSASRMIFASDMGITAEYLLPVWSEGTIQVGDSRLILEGGNF